MISPPTTQRTMIASPITHTSPMPITHKITLLYPMTPPSHHQNHLLVTSLMHKLCTKISQNSLTSIVKTIPIIFRPPTLTATKTALRSNPPTTVTSTAQTTKTLQQRRTTKATLHIQVNESKHSRPKVKRRLYQH